jgi:hypothetical protein
LNTDTIAPCMVHRDYTESKVRLRGDGMSAEEQTTVPA